MRLEELTSYLDELLQTPKYRDYCPNGLQVEGCGELTRLVAGVTASQKLLDLAVAHGAQAVLVHHGYFWKGEDGRLTGMRRRRIATLVANDISLLAYHLPLDGHPEFGNNARLAQLFGWQPEGRFGDQDIGWFGTLPTAMCVGDVAAQVADCLGRQPMVIGDSDRQVKRVAWCSGGAQGYFEQAIALGVDLYLSGEISEQTVHLAEESGVAYLAAGHHATERGGVQALAEHLQARFGLDCRFIDVDNPV